VRHLWRRDPPTPHAAPGPHWRRCLRRRGCQRLDADSLGRRAGAGGCLDGALHAPPSASSSPFDDQALRRIDQAFEAAAAAVSEPALAHLIALKATAARVALAIHRAEVDGNFTAEHRLYVIEAIRRYIPDTLSAYLQVPSAQRALPGAQAGPSADQLLLAQLALLQSELEQRELLLHADSVEPLLRQQRFLQAKAAGR
jgi:hypothetical protein